MRLKTLILTLFVFFATAAPALAQQFEDNDNGEGMAGELTDKYITFFSLGVTLFFAIVVIVGSLVQGALERRKEERKTQALRQRIGW
jgi:hypothetical protein